MRKLVVMAMLMASSTAHAGLFDIVADVAKEVSPEAGKAVDIWTQEQDRKQAEIEENERKAEEDRLEKERQKALEQEKILEEQKRIELEKQRKADQAKYEAEKAQKASNEQDRRIAELEAKLKLAEQRAEKEKSTATEAVQEVDGGSKAKEAAPAPTKDEIKQAVKTVNIPNRYAKATLMMKSAYYDNSYDEYMNFGEWVTRIYKKGSFKQLWTEGGTFSDLQIHIKQTGSPTAIMYFYEDGGEVFLRSLNNYAPTNPQLKERLDYQLLYLN